MFHTIVKMLPVMVLLTITNLIIAQIITGRTTTRNIEAGTTATATAFQSDTISPVGIWEGKLQIPNSPLRIIFEIEKRDGRLHAKMASPDQGATNIPVESVTWHEDSLTLDVKAIGGVYAAVYTPDSPGFKGSWKQALMEMPLVLKKKDSVVYFSKRPQEPEKPYPYREENVQFKNKDDGITLGGTLTIPRGKGPFPSVLLITGSGAQNRDEEIMGHKPFLILADYLTRQGIVVLRYDDRGVGESTGSAATATSADNARDARAGIDFLQKHTAVKHKMIGIIGHSEGAMIAPMLASTSSDIAFLVLLAGPGLTGAEIHRLQTEYILEKQGASATEVEKVLTRNKKVYSLIQSREDTADIRKELTDILTDEFPDQQTLTTVVNGFSLPWLRYFIKFDPEQYLTKINCPVLAVNGEKDVQVSAKENLPAIAQALKTAGNKHATIKALPGLNHLFQTAETGDIVEYAKIQETFSPTALQIIGDWIKKTTDGLK